MAIQIRQATAADFEVALPLLQRFFNEEGFQTPPEQIRVQLAGLLNNPKVSAVFLAWQEAKAVGVATVTTSRGIEFGHTAELEDLYILPEARGQGAGRALIAAVHEWCHRQGCTVVSVVVTPEGQAAHDLINYYRAQGFKESGRTILFYHLDNREV